VHCMGCGSQAAALVQSEDAMVMMMKQLHVKGWRGWCLKKGWWPRAVGVRVMKGKVSRSQGMEMGVVAG
jgi:hypothetical protein